jgi:hypothetical protein
MVSTVVIILTFVVAVYGHECKDFKLSASDQSVIDMMKHYSTNFDILSFNLERGIK